MVIRELSEKQFKVETQPIYSNFPSLFKFIKLPTPRGYVPFGEQYFKLDEAWKLDKFIRDWDNLGPGYYKVELEKFLKTYARFPREVGKAELGELLRAFNINFKISQGFLYFRKPEPLRKGHFYFSTSKRR